MKIRLLEMLTWFALQCRVYYAWSKVYRFLFERKYKGVKMPVYFSLDQLREDVAKMQWRKDDWFMLRDAVSLPEATWSRHMRKEPAGDCDDISIFITDRLVELQKILPGTFSEVGLLSVPWVNRHTGETGGHNVCIYKHVKGALQHQWYHMSNWYNSYPQGPFRTLESVVYSILKDKRSLGYAVATPKLKLVYFGRVR